MTIAQYLIVLIVPLITLICGVLSRRFPPADINSVYGYRTPRSMKDEESWNLAQKLMSDFFFYYSAVSLAFGAVLSVICRIFYNRDFIPTVIMLVQAIGILSVIFYVENKLKNANKHIDKDKE